MKLRSIRWRLVASYMLLTLLTAGLVGALALSLVKERTDQQEIDYLTANADAAARQAVPLIWPIPHQYDLQRLAQTSAFLGNVRVRFLDARNNVLADSGSHTALDTFVWVMPPEQHDLYNRDGDVEPFIMSLVIGGQNGASGVTIPGIGSRQGQLPPGSQYMIVQREDGPWGRRFVFRPYPDAASAAASTGSSGTSSAQTAQALPTATIAPSTTMSDLVAADRSNRTVSVPIANSGRTLGYVELSGAPDFSAETLSTMAPAVLLAAIGASLVAGVVALFVGRGLTAPLNSLALAANKMSSGDLTVRAPVMRDDETGQLARQFNEMAERLQASFAELAAERDTLRRFIADASHELRTPITALKMFNELLRNSASNDPSARDEFLAESQAQIERLEWITRNLLDLSRLDSGVADLELSLHDAGDILQASAAAFKQIARERDINLNVCSPEPPIAVHCDRARIQIALSNLIDNALRFTPHGGQIVVCASTHNHDVQVSVQDSGTGIDPADLPHIFERFYRGKDSGPRGSGLGLALVRSVVLAHGGQVSVQSASGQGSTFTISLPQAVPV